MGGGQWLRGADCVGEGSTSGFLQSHCPARKAFPASDEHRAAGALSGVASAAGGGPVGPGHRPLPTFRHFREKQMTASVSQMSSSSSTALTPLACPERPPQPEGAPRVAGGWGTPGRRAVSVDACDSPSAVLVLTSHFPKKKEINIQIHLSSKWSFAAKKKSYSSSRGSGGKAALRYAER